MLMECPLSSSVWIRELFKIGLSVSDEVLDKWPYDISSASWSQSGQNHYKKGSGLHFVLSEKTKKTTKKQQPKHPDRKNS